LIPVAKNGEKIYLSGYLEGQIFNVTLTI